MWRAEAEAERSQLASARVAIVSRQQRARSAHAVYEYTRSTGPAPRAADDMQMEHEERRWFRCVEPLAGHLVGPSTHHTNASAQTGQSQSQT